MSTTFGRLKCFLHTKKQRHFTNKKKMRENLTFGSDNVNIESSKPIERDFIYVMFDTTKWLLRIHTEIEI